MVGKKVSESGRTGRPHIGAMCVCVGGFKN